MKRDPVPSDLVVELLRTLDEALVDFAPGAEGGGVRLMPSTYTQGSYPELERRLREMRDSQRWRREWWHTSSRYLWGSYRWLKVPYRKTAKGPQPWIPDYAEERIQGDVVQVRRNGHIENYMWVKCYVWSDQASLSLAREGVSRLVATMYQGDTTRLRLPKPFLDRWLGGRNESQPGVVYIPSAQVAAAASSR